MGGGGQGEAEDRYNSGLGSSPPKLSRLAGSSTSGRPGGRQRAVAQVTRDVGNPWTPALVPSFGSHPCSPWVIPPAPRLHPPSRKPLVHAHLELRLDFPVGPNYLIHSSRPTLTLGSIPAALNLVSPPFSSPTYSPSPWAVLAPLPPALRPLAFSPWTLTAASTLASRLSSLPVLSPFRHKGLSSP